MKAAILAMLAVGCTTEASLGNTRTPTETATDPFGAARWAIVFGTDEGSDPGAIAFDRDGNVLVAGTRWTRSPQTDLHGMITARARADGAELWRVELTGRSQVMAIAVDSTGAAVATGMFSGSVDFGGQVLATAGDASDLFVAKYGADGALSWARALGCDRAATGSTIAIGSDDTIYVGGWFRGVVDVGDGPVGQTVGWETQMDGVLVALSPTGGRTWGRTWLGGAFATDLLPLPDGNLVALGTASDGVSVGGEPLSVPPLGRAFVARFGADGTHQWSRIQSAPSEVDDAPMGLALQAGQVIVTIDESLRGQETTAVSGLELDGTEAWTTRVNGAEAVQPAATSSGIVIGGRIAAREATFGTATVTGPMFLASYGPAGEIIGARSFALDGTTPSSNAQTIFGTASRADEVAFVAGLSAPVDFGTGSLAPDGPLSLAIVLLDPPE